jgi:hypothetical protein
VKATKRFSAISLLFLIFFSLSINPIEQEVDLVSIAKMPLVQRIEILRRIITQGKGNYSSKLLLSKSLIENKNYSEAETLLEDEEIMKSPLFEYGIHFLIKAKTLKNQNYFPEALYLKLSSAINEPSFKEESLKELSNYYIKIKDYRNAIFYLKELLNQNFNNPEILSKIVRSLMELKDEDSAFEFFKTLYINSPLNKEFLSLCKDYPSLLQKVDGLKIEEKIERLYKLEEAMGYFSLEREFNSLKPFLKDDEKRFFNSSLLVSRNSLLEAQKGYLSIEPTSSLYKTGLLRASRSVKSLSKETLEIEKRLILLEDCIEKQKGLKSLFTFYKKSNLEKDCLRVAFELLPFLDDDASEYIFKNAYSSLLDGRKRECFSMLKKLRELLPNDNDYHQSALFSLIKLKSLDKKEEEKEIRELLSSSKYGYYGYRLRNGEFPQCNSSSQILPPYISPELYKGRVLKSSLLLDSGLLEESIFELEETLKENESNELLWLLALTASKAEYYPKSVRAVRKIYKTAFSEDGDKIPKQVWMMIYPLPFEESFKKVAKNNDLLPVVLYSIARQESLFDKNAISRANALGIVQLLPSTAKMVAKQNSIPFYTNDSLFDPEFNLELGAKYFLSLNKRFDEKLYLALASYNAGPGNVSKWLQRQNNPQDEELFIESIPFKETRSYVKRIINNIYEYKRIYPEIEKN